MSRAAIFSLGIASVLAATWLWHGPMGAGGRFAAKVERAARVQLDHDEMVNVRAEFARMPLTRRLSLSGPADDFQRQEIKRRMEALPGVSEADWAASSLKSESAM